MLGTVTEKQKASEKTLAPADASAYGALPLSTATRFEHFSKYPYIVRDIAMWTSSTDNEQQVQQTIQKEAGPLAVKVSLFDAFSKEGRTSLAYRIVFQSFDRTLTEAEVNQIMAKLSLILVDKGFVIR